MDGRAHAAGAVSVGPRAPATEVSRGPTPEGPSPAAATAAEPSDWTAKLTRIWRPPGWEASGAAAAPPGAPDEEAEASAPAWWYRDGSLFVGWVILVVLAALIINVAVGVSNKNAGRLGDGGGLPGVPSPPSPPLPGMPAPDLFPPPSNPPPAAQSPGAPPLTPPLASPPPPEGGSGWSIWLGQFNASQRNVGSVCPDASRITGWLIWYDAALAGDDDLSPFTGLAATCAGTDGGPSTSLALMPGTGAPSAEVNALAGFQIADGSSGAFIDELFGRGLGGGTRFRWNCSSGEVIQGYHVATETLPDGPTQVLTGLRVYCAQP